MRTFCYIFTLYSWFSFFPLTEINAQAIADTSDTDNFNLFARAAIDTTPISYFRSDNPSQSYLYRDSSLINFQQYDPARRQRFDYGHLGNLGSAARPLYFEPVFRRGVDIGLHQFDLYHTAASDLKFFDSKKGITAASFNVGGEQADSYLKILFGRTFARGIALSIEHQRLAQRGGSFQFLHQNTAHSVFTIGLGFQPQHSPYRAFVTYAANISEQEENGGILLDTLFAQRPFEERVVTESANTFHRHRTLAIQQYLRLFGSSEDSLIARRYFTLSHKFLYKHSHYKFSEKIPLDTIRNKLNGFRNIYNGFITDSRGLRMYIGHERIENRVALQTWKQGQTPGSQSDFFELGARYTHHWLRQEPDTLQLNNLFLFGQWNFQPSDNFKLNSYAHLGLVQNAGDYRIEGNFDLEFENLGKLSGSFINQLFEPTIIQNRFFINQTPVWTHTFSKTLSTSISGDLQVTPLNLTVTGGYHLINNAVYFDTVSYPQQSSIPLSIFQIGLIKNFKIWKFHLDNTLFLQEISEDFIRLPNFFSKHSFYFKDRIFKNRLDFQIGLDSRFYNTYFADSYQPLSGQFYLQNGQSVKTVPQIDLFAAIKVQTFRAFIKLENAIELLGVEYLESKFGQRYFYQTAYYPYPPIVIRWGISWRLGA